jgi:hypothetical protein
MRANWRAVVIPGVDIALTGLLYARFKGQSLAAWDVSRLPGRIEFIVEAFRLEDQADAFERLYVETLRTRAN